jgi:hypothetical protein
MKETRETRGAYCPESFDDSCPDSCAGLSFESSVDGSVTGAAYVPSYRARAHGFVAWAVAL